MTLGPIEVIVVGFASDHFDADIIPELERLVDAGTIAIVDGVYVQVGANADTSIVEFEADDADPNVARVAALIGDVTGLVSHDDVASLTDHLPVSSSAAVLVFEHRWLTSLHERITAGGGSILNSIRVPAESVQAVLDDIAAIDKDDDE